MSTAIEIVRLSKIYSGKFGKRVAALVDVDLTIRAGEVFGFLGPNGAGKSTTIKTLLGQIRPTGGHATLYGVPVGQAVARKSVGYLPENPAFYDFMTAREYLWFVGRAYEMTAADISREAARVLDLLDLHEAADRPIRGYSKGMVQRLGLAQALLHNPDLYILDEPMSGLDPLGRSLVKEIIKDLKQQGKTVFFSTHITADIEVVCDRVGVISKGRLVAVDSVASILDKGLIGYTIQLVRSGGTPEEVFVQVDELKTFMADVLEKNAEIERIEPKRKDMEAFFLDILTGSSHAS